MTIEDVQALAWNVMALPAPKKQTPNQTAALYRYWLEHKDEVGARMTAELALADGTAAIVTASSKVLWWKGGDEVEVV
jgi:hypothetical protein